MQINYWSHQKKALEFIRSRPYSLLYSPMSSGKTLIALKYLSEIDGMKLILSPIHAFGVWEEDNQKFKLGLDIVVLDQSTTPRKKKVLEGLDTDSDLIVVVNYASGKLLPLENYPFKAVVADEAHRLGGQNSQQSTKLARKLKDVPIKIAMTGTPYTDGYKSLYGIARWLDPNPKGRVTSNIFGTWNDFLNGYCHVWFPNPYVPVPRGYKNLDKLSEVVAPFTMVVDLEKVIEEAIARGEDVKRLPKVISREYKVELKGEIKKAYRELEKEGIVTIDDFDYVAPHVLTKLIRLQQLTTSGILKDNETGKETVLDGLSNRIAILKSLLVDIGEEPVVIFTRFRRDVDLISDIVGDAAYLTGDKDNHKEWRDGKYQYLIVNISAGSEGVRLERARHAIFWSVGYSAADYSQAIGRIRRTNSDYDTVLVSNIITKGTVDEDIYKAIREKLANEEKLTTKIVNVGEKINGNK